MAQAEAVGQHRGADQDGLMRERDKGPDPGREIAGNKESIDRDDPGSKIEHFGLSAFSG